MTNDYGRTKFKRFAKANRLRLKAAEDGCPIVEARQSKKLQGWHLYEGHSDDYCYLFIQKQHKKGFNIALKKLTQDFGLDVHRLGDLEAVFLVPYGKAYAIAKEYNMVKKQPSNVVVQNMIEYNKKKKSN